MKENHPDLKQVLRNLLDIEASVWGMARLFSPPAPSSAPYWGLLVLDSSGDLHFISFTQESWVSQLFSSAEKDKGPVRAHECYPRGEVRSLIRKKQGFLSSLINPSCRYALYMDGRDEPVLFELENPERAIQDALASFPS